MVLAIVHVLAEFGKVGGEAESWSKIGLHLGLTR